MKTVKNLFKMYANYKSKKSRLRSVELALKADLQSQNIVDVSTRIDKYINEGL
jgi:hypothetical protein